MFEEYGELSTELYDFTKPIGHEIDGDLTFYLEQVKSATGLVLEAGVGTGRMLVPFAEKGIKIEGVDLSPFMLEKCQHHLNERKLEVKLYLQDLQALDLPKKYQMIIMPTGSFALLPTREMMLKSLTAFKHHLLPGGKLILDLLLPRDFQEGNSSTTTCELSDSTGIIFNSTSLTIDWEAQRTTELHRYEKWVKGQMVQTELSQFILSWYGIEEFKLILEKIGFKNCQVIWDYGQNSGAHATLTFIAEA